MNFIRSTTRRGTVSSPPAHLAVLVLVGVLASGPVQTAGAQEIDSASLMRDMSVLAHDSMQGRRVGTPESAMARRYIVERLRGMGLTVREESFAVRDGVEGVNVVAEVPGQGNGPRIVLTAHYDHLGVRDGQVFNGADDNASGTAGVLAIGAAMAANPLQHGVTLILFDAEEGGLRGARAWVGAMQEQDRLSEIALNVNLDMVSRSTEELWVTGTYQNPSLRPVLEGIDPVPGVTLRFGHDSPEWTGSDNWVSASDHGPFHAAGLPFLYFGVEDHPDYHGPGDDVEKVDPVWYAGSIETILRSIRALDTAMAGG